MNCTEFSNEFDVLYNNLSSNQAPGLNEYEKSVLLTKAQEQLVRDYFNGTSNKLSQGYDDSPKRQADFSNITRSMGILFTNSENTELTYDPRGYVFTLYDSSNTDNQIFLILNESVVIAGNHLRQVIPLSFLEYTRLMSRPYKEPLKWQAWRLYGPSGQYNIIDGNTVKSDYPRPRVEVILNTRDKKMVDENPETSQYNIRYVKRPSPIILTDLTDIAGEDLSILGGTKQSECELNPALHEEILQRAVELAKHAYAGQDSQYYFSYNSPALSQTDIGQQQQQQQNSRSR